MTHKQIFDFEGLNQPLPAPDGFYFGVTGLAHSHIYDMCRGLTEAGAVLKCVYDEDSDALAKFRQSFPDAAVCADLGELLADRDIRLVACADIPVRRAQIGIQAMRAGKDFFSDKAPMISLEQVEAVRTVCRETGRRYAVYYGESVHNEAAIFAQTLIQRGVIGDVFHIDGFAPHRLGADGRPAWFFKPHDTGGILIDLGSHQAQQFLSYSGSGGARVKFARTRNYNNPRFPEFEDFGDMVLTADNGVTGYFRVDWSSPGGLSTWGDARTIIEGSDGYIELRKNCNIASASSANHVYVVTDDGEFYQNVTGKVGFPFFGRLLYDCINRTETAMSQELALRAAELAIEAEQMAGNPDKAKVLEFSGFGSSTELLIHKGGNM